MRPREGWVLAAVLLRRPRPARRADINHHSRRHAERPFASSPALPCNRSCLLAAVVRYRYATCHFMRTCPKRQLWLTRRRRRGAGRRDPLPGFLMERAALTALGDLPSRSSSSPSSTSSLIARVRKKHQLHPPHQAALPVGSLPPSPVLLQRSMSSVQDPAAGPGQQWNPAGYG